MAGPWEKYKAAPAAAAGPWAKYAQPAEQPAPEQEEKRDVGAYEAILPRTYKADVKEGAGLGRQALSAGMDVLSLPGRAVASTVGQMGRGDRGAGSFGQYAGMPKAQPTAEPQGETFNQSMAKTESKGLGGVVRDPAMLPSLMVGGPAVAGVGKMALGGLRAGLTSAGLHQGDRVSRGQGVSGGEAAAEVAINTVAPVALKGVGALVKGGVGKVKTILSKFSDVDEAALKAASNPETLKAAQDVTRRTAGDLSGMADDLSTKTQAMQADEANAIASVNASRQGSLEQGLKQARPWADNLEVSPFDAGKRIETAAQGTRKAAGERFQAGQDAILEGQKIGGKGVSFGGVDGNQTPFEQTVDRFLADAGVGQGGKNYGVIGNVSVPAGAINEIRGLKETFKSGLTTRDMLDQLRLVDNRLNFGGADGRRLFASGSQEDLAMKGLRARLSDDLEGQIARAAGKQKNAVLAAWHAHREAYSNTASALEKIQDGIGAGTLNHEAYFSRIKNIGVEDLRSLAAEAKKNPDLAPTWNELRKGYFDNIIASGVKENGIDYQAIKKTWDAMDDDLKTTMMPTKVISHIDGVLDRTAPLDFKGSTLADANRMVGKDRQSLISSLENIGSKAKRSDMEDLRKLDDLLGLEGKDRFSEQAGSFYLGKQLGMTEKGALPLFTGSRTGAKLAGAGLGATAGGLIGTQQGGAEGGSIGGGMGMLAGVAIQSPAGALAAYKILNQMRKAAVVGEKEIARPLARRGLSSGLLTRSLTTSQYGGSTNK